MSNFFSVSRQVGTYRKQDGIEPFVIFMDGMKDKKGKAAIYNRVRRAENGNFGERHGVGKGVFEMVVNVGPGYRVYYGIDGLVVVVLLSVGNKSSQSQDIKEAHSFWEDYKRQKSKT